MLDSGLWMGASAEWIQGLGSIKIQEQQHLPKQSKQPGLYFYGFVPGFSLHFCFPRNIHQCLEMFWVSQVGCGCSWHLEGKSQGCCQTPYNAQDIPLQQRVLLPQMCIKPWGRSPTPRNLFSGNLERQGAPDHLPGAQTGHAPYSPRGYHPLL